jgi:hypothetical protein
MQKAEVHAFRKMVDGDECEYTESPKYEGMRDPRQRPLRNHFALQQNFPDEIDNSAADRLNVKIGLFFRPANDTPNSREACPKAKNGSRQQDEEQRRLRPGQLGHQLRV